MAIIKYTLVRKDREIYTDQDPHGGTRLGRALSRSPKKIVEKGERFVLLAGGKYHITGDWHPFRYRLRRSLYLAEHIGHQMIWLEGHPEPFDFDEVRRLELRQRTEQAWTKVNDARATIERVFRPRRVDWLLSLLLLVVGLAVGYGIGVTLSEPAPNGVAP